MKNVPLTNCHNYLFDDIWGDPQITENKNISPYSVFSNDIQWNSHNFPSPGPDHPESCHLIVQKLPFFSRKLSENCHFFSKIAKKCHFFQKFPNHNCLKMIFLMF